MKLVTIYTGPLCNYCEAAKRLLTRNKVEYKEIDISKVDGAMDEMIKKANGKRTCLLYTSPSPRDRTRSRMPSSAWKKKVTPP